VNSVTEANFGREISQNLDSVNIKYESPADDAINKVYLVDKLFVKGVSADRSKNDTNLDYVQSKDMEASGIRQYIHKFHLGLQPYYFKKHFE